MYIWKCIQLQCYWRDSIWIIQCLYSSKSWIFGAFARIRISTIPDIFSYFSIKSIILCFWKTRKYKCSPLFEALLLNDEISQNVDKYITREILRLANSLKALVGIYYLFMKSQFYLPHFSAFTNTCLCTFWNIWRKKCK